MQRANVICRSCGAMCPLIVDIEKNKPVSIIGDKHNPVFHGYSCIKGREMVNTIYSPERLYKSVKRLPDGTFAEIGSRQALDEIAAVFNDVDDPYLRERKGDLHDVAGRRRRGQPLAVTEGELAVARGPLPNGARPVAA